ncbi:MAG: hypothetical protein ACOYIH_03825 [Candidatus Fimadaptatus sp.]
MSEEAMSNPAQRRKLGRGMVLSVAGVLICWVPGLGALLSLIGLYSVISSYVPECRGRYVAYVVLSILCALLSVGALVAMLYVYFGDPELLSRITSFVMEKLNIQ